ncbi:undecaprenyldiphospho-muramoylpentapeptide beta-N-acetylglucosaminyltransferase [Ascidiimonas sp. W6]|uniref:undecaprenyldiphospho-muramoylpentapeptide beta-N-acetylglucosaminyltransferase n=1 Tax=Ascidiimonas meishanensis TaxID=3128903 RepID=UPI0030EBF374
MSSYKFIISGGGTGGHIYPAIAIANELRLRYPEATFLFVGAKGRMEMEKVPLAGYEIKGLWIAGFQRKLTLKNLMFPFKLVSSMLKARSIIKKRQPDLVIGTGGYASGPLLKMAALNHIPYVLQEQNSYPGITNRMLASNASRICVAYDGLEKYFPEDKIVKTGNPVRKDLLNIASKRDNGIRFFELDETKKTILILGGSLGARMMNKIVEDHLPLFEKLKLQLIWQCGKLYKEDYKKYNQDAIKVVSFIANMDEAYAAADIIISRAGAGSISELAIVGKPVIFIPSPNVAEDHQAKNAKALVDKGAALMLKEDQAAQEFGAMLKNLMSSEAAQKELSTNISRLAKPEATRHIVDEIENILKSKL